MKPDPMQPWVQPSPASTRSQIILETVSEMVAPREFAYRQALIKLRGPGDEDWAFTFAAGDSADLIREVARR